MKFIDNALQAYVIAINEGRHGDSEYVKRLFYKFYEEDLSEKQG